MNYRTILSRNPFLNRVFARLSRIFFLRVNMDGGNTLILKNVRYLSPCTLRIKGKRNTVIFGDLGTFRNLHIEVIGHDNVIEIGDKVWIYEKLGISVKGDHCKAKIGTLSTFGEAVFFLEESDSSIVIGEDCMFGREVILSTTDFHSILDLETKRRINKAADIVIGHHVWVGTDVDIAKGAHIADHCVVAAKSLVNKEFEKTNVILAGMPAKIVKEGITWCRDIV